MSVSERNHRIVVAGAGYAGLHVAMRLATKLRDNLGVQLTLVDWHDFHQVMTELPRVAGGTRAADAVRIPLEDVVARGVRFMETQITGFDLAGQQCCALERRQMLLPPGVRLFPNGFMLACYFREARVAIR